MKFKKQNNIWLKSIRGNNKNDIRIRFIVLIDKSRKIRNRLRLEILLMLGRDMIMKKNILKDKKCRQDN